MADAISGDYGLISVLPSKFPGLYLRDDSTPGYAHMDDSRNRPMRFANQGQAAEWLATKVDPSSRGIFHVQVIAPAPLAPPG